MTLETFLEKLEQTPRDWRGPLLRRAKLEQCPLSCLCDLPSWNWVQAADQLGIDFKQARKIMRAADCYGAKSLRAKLLKACGLEAA